jgi:hypothetical protein
MPPTSRPRQDNEEFLILPVSPPPSSTISSSEFSFFDLPISNVELARPFDQPNWRQHATVEQLIDQFRSQLSFGSVCPPSAKPVADSRRYVCVGNIPVSTTLDDLSHIFTVR